MDFMKKTNDLYGHDMGDSAIKEIASIILKVISKELRFVMVVMNLLSLPIIHRKIFLQK